MPFGLGINSLVMYYNDVFNQTFDKTHKEKNPYKLKRKAYIHIQKTQLFWYSWSVIYISTFLLIVNIILDLSYDYRLALLDVLVALSLAFSVRKSINKEESINLALSIAIFIMVGLNIYVKIIKPLLN